MEVDLYLHYGVISYVCMYEYIYILTGLMFNTSPPIGTFLLHKWMCPAMHGMLHRAPSSLIRVMFRQAKSRIQALQIDMDDPTLLCMTERIGIDSKNQIEKTYCTGLLQV